MTTAGVIQIARTYFRCPHCQTGGYPADAHLGIEGRFSIQTRRLVCLAAASWSYDLATQRLREFCGLSVSDTTIRELSQAAGADMLAWQRTEPEAVRNSATRQGTWNSPPTERR